METQAVYMALLQDPDPILHTRRAIREFLGGVSDETLQALIDDGMPVKVIGKTYLADRLALRQWLGVKLPAKSGATVEQIMDEIKRRLA